MLYRPDAPNETPGPCREPSRAAAIFGEIRRCFLEECGDARALPALAIWSGLTIVSLPGVFRQAFGASDVRLEIRQAWGAAVVAVLLSVVAKRLLKLTGCMHPSLTIRSVAALCGAFPLCVLATMSFGQLPVNVTLCIAGMAAATGCLLLLPTPGGNQSSPLVRSHQTQSTIPYGAFRLEEPHATPAGHYLPPSRKETRHRGTNPDTRDSAGLQTVPDKNAWQWMSRTQRAGGGEMIQGVTRAYFAAGEKQTVAHLAFNPPFAGVPEFACVLADDSVARVKLAAAYPYGIRIELKRSACEAAASVEIRYTATSQAAKKAA